MPKTPPIERIEFTVIIDDKKDVGDVMMQFSKLPLRVVGSRVIAEVAAFASRQTHDVKADDFLSAWLADHPTFRAKEAVAYFREAGRTEAMAYRALRVMVEVGKLRKLDAGRYQRADVKAIAPPKKTFEKSGPDTILSYMRRSHGRATAKRIERLFADEGRSANSVGPCLDKLVKHRKIRRDGDGVYEIVTKKRAVTKKLNGAKVGAAKSEVVSNG